MRDEEFYKELDDAVKEHGAIALDPRQKEAVFQLFRKMRNEIAQDQKDEERWKQSTTNTLHPFR